MGILTNFLKLLKPEPNDFYNQQTEQAENWDKVDKFAKDVTTDVATQDSSIWGGEYGGLIQGQTTKVVGKRYVDSADGKSYICIKAGSNVNTAEFYTECTVKGNLDRLQNLIKEEVYGSRINGDLGKSFSHPQSVKNCKKLLSMEVVYSNTISGTRHSVIFTDLNFVEHMFILQNTSVVSPAINNIVGIRLLGTSSSVVLDVSPNTGVIAFVKYVFV